MTSSAGTGIPRARLQRDVRSLKSLLRIGDTYTTGDVFDSIQFRGVQLMSDDEMLPDSQRGFTPTIRGVAHSNAKVTVSQHGYVIYGPFVSPGHSPSAILPHLAERRSGGEGDREQWRGAYLTQPYSAVPCCAKGAANCSAPPLPLRGVGALVGISAGHLFTLYGLTAIQFHGTQPARDIRRGRWAWAAVLASSIAEDVTRAVTRTPSGKRMGHCCASVSEKFCQLGHCVQPRQLSLLVKRLLRFCRSQRP